MKFGTRAVREEVDDNTGAITTPVYMTTAYAFPRGEKYRYSREANPTVLELGRKIAELEGGEAGVAFSSGMGAISTTLLTLLRPGLKLIVQRDMFGRSLKFCSSFLGSWGVKTVMAEPGSEDLIEKVTEGADLVFVESVTNPLLRVIDLPALAKACRETSAKLVVDSTFATPVNQRPLEVGADVVLHSASKFIAGHNDVIAGLAAGSSELMNQVDQMRRSLGTSLDPHAAYLVLRGMKTLKVRMETLERNAMALAEFLESHPKVRRVYYPWLKSHPDYQVARRVLSGGGGVLSFEVNGDPTAVMRSVRVITPAQTLGGVNSVISHPATMTHRSLTPEERRAAGIDDSLLRLSVGIEELEDLVEDLDRALSKA
ncbi:hypothetical protein HS1genome_1309 [Sulfodiicoccus acidiphilus]|uniref:Cystathionine gamma-synthase n=1 Tax=Sulfodiicoccus acidiphilus TaxID=1670455 RepID=A0A348B418_9CREN|nr:aminotransferase class I/II-fold pyridoxal phosphate-dependent enzyme [Sulfodiicoccus acidiphilus]BBD72920.1 hypothetical protein HS1genome_1309 [Sulfodiicoccus acidiphilus]GGT87996.1 hypothetical protein GCM10007116_02430 [Sulfodiicoccus acidiphilus]